MNKTLSSLLLVALAAGPALAQGGRPFGAPLGGYLGKSTAAGDDADQLAAYLTLKAYSEKSVRPAPLPAVEGRGAALASSQDLRSRSIDAPPPPPPHLRDAVASIPAPAKPSTGAVLLGFALGLLLALGLFRSARKTKDA